MTSSVEAPPRPCSSAMAQPVRSLPAVQWMTDAPVPLASDASSVR